MKLYRRIIKKIKELLCQHPDRGYNTEEIAKYKYKSVRGGRAKPRYDIWRKSYCIECGKLLSKKKVRADLTETEVRMRFNSEY